MSYKSDKKSYDDNGLKNTLLRCFKTIDLKLLPENLIYSFGEQSEKDKMASLVDAVHDACFYKHTDGQEYRFLVRDPKTQKYVIKIPPTSKHDLTPLFSLPLPDADMIAAYESALDALNSYVNPLLYKYLPTLIDNVKAVDPLKYWVIGIVHDRDYNSDDFWQPSIEKPHIHINGKALCKSFHLCTWFKLLGIELRVGIDDVSFFNGYGLRSISDREDDKEYGNRFSRAVNYLTHDTDKAKMDGKTQYDVKDLFTNLTDEEIVAIRKGTRPATLSTAELKRICADLDKQAYDIGYSLRDFNDWWAEQMYSIRTRATDRKAIQESYNRGLHARINLREDFDKLVLIISSPANCGKTETAKRTLVALGYDEHDICYITTTGNGKYDSIHTYSRALVVDDVHGSSMLSLCDSRICELAARNYNRVFTGDIIIILTNKAPDTYLRDCLGDKDNTNRETHFEAARSRCCSVCISIKDNSPYFHPVQYSYRGNLHAFSVAARCNKFLAEYKRQLATFDFGYRIESSQDVAKLIDRYGDPVRAYIGYRAFCDYYRNRYTPGTTAAMYHSWQAYCDHEVFTYDAVADIPDDILQELADMPAPPPFDDADDEALLLQYQIYLDDSAQ